MLNEYLKFKFNAAAPKEQTVISGNVRFTVITTRLIRIEQDSFCDNASQSILNRSFSSPLFKSFEADGWLYIETEHLRLAYKIGSRLSAAALQISLLSKPYTCWHYGDKAVCNLGGTVSTLDRVSGSTELEDGVCSIEGYATIDDSSTALFAEDGWFKIRESRSVDLYFFGYGHDYISCVADYCRLTGEVKMLPAFALGNWWSRYHRYTEDSYLSLMDEFAQKDIPLSVAVIDMDWHLVNGIEDEYWNNAGEKDRNSIGYTLGWTGYTWDKELFPDYKRFLKALHDRGLKATLNLHPSGGVRFWEEQYEDMARAMGIDPKSKDAVPFDCLNPEFVNAYFDILHFPFEKNGVDFWWMDWQQGSDYNWVHQFGIEKNPLEIISPLWMLNHIHHLASKRNGKRGLIFSRFSGVGSQRFPIGFSGDTYTAWESLEFQPYFTATASNIGYGWWSHDIGGHIGGDRDDELQVRWTQYGVFSPIFRFHSAADRFLGREPWNFGAAEEKIISDFMRLRHQLFPYLYTMNYRSYSEQLPLIMPIYYTNPEDKAAYGVKNEYWFGSELIAAPITRRADKESMLGYSDVWLPEGRWIDWFSGYVYKGGRGFECYRKTEEMPLFCKAGAIIPMQKHKARDNSLGLSCELELVVAAGANGEFAMYEDDGSSENYQSGKGAKTKFELAWRDNEALLRINSAEGCLELIPENRSYNIIFKGFKAGCRFYMGDRELAFKYNFETNSYTVDLGIVKTAAGCELSVKSDSGIIHDNSDYLRKCEKLLLHSQTVSVVRNSLYALAEGMQTNIMWKCEPIGDNRLSRALYELAIQNI